ncbi:MAG TPA: hypothetical protein PLP18_00460 [Smithellaceae bacterium]|nr:hypothetical protein [Smithellaceae bacterium]
MRSILKKESQKPKELARTFSLKISNNLFNCKKWTQEVINEIENDRLLVLSASKPFSLDLSGDSFIQIDSCFRKPVSIKEWLPIACQNIRCQEGESDEFNRPNALACYTSNAGEVLFPVGLGTIPPGPVAFNAAIIIHTEINTMLKVEEPGGEDRFKFVLAHELVHVFDFMRILVPAFQNWKRFWKICLEEGDACEKMEQLCMYKNCFVDSYGTETELAMVEQYWPKKARKWYEAFRM